MLCYIDIAPRLVCGLSSVHCLYLLSALLCLQANAVHISGFNWNTASSNTSVMFDHVARAILGGFDGTAGSLPNVISSGSTHNKAYSHTLPANQAAGNVHVVSYAASISSIEIYNINLNSLDLFFIFLILFCVV